MSLNSQGAILSPSGSIYYFKHYKLYLRHLLNSNSSMRGYQAALARAAGCKPSYFSGVIRGNLDLTPDQVMGIAVYLNLTARETEYFLNILALGKTKFGPLISHLETRIEQLRDGMMAKEFSLEAIEFKMQGLQK